MSKLKIAYVEITTWDGYCPGAIHYYGKFIYEEEIFELKRKLTKHTAQILTEQKNDGWRYRPGQETKCFDTEDEIRKLASKESKKRGSNS